MDLKNIVSRWSLGELKIWHKLGLVCLAFCIPIGVLLYFMVTEQQKPISFAQKELYGTEYLRPCRDLMEHTLRHRLLVNRQANKQLVTSAEVADARAKVSASMRNLEAVNTKHGERLSQKDRTTEQYLSAIRQKWQGLQKPGLSAKDSDEGHSALVKELRGLMALVGDTSNLILDPDIDSYYTMDTVLNKLPEGFELVGQLINDGEEMVGKKMVSPEEKTQLIVQNGLIRSLYATMSSTYGGLPVAYRKENDTTDGHVLESKLSQPLGTAVATANGFLADVDKRVVNSPEVALEPREFTEQGEATLSASFVLWDESVQALDLLLTRRVGQFRRAQYVTFAFSAAAVALAGVLTFFIVRGFTRQIAAMQDVFQQIGIGNFEARAAIISRDELGDIAGVLNDNLLPLVSSQQERHEMQTSIQKLLEEVAGVADGDLTKEAEVTADMTGAIADSFNHMIEQLRRIIGDVQDTAVQVSTSATQIQATAEGLANGAQTQSAQIVSTSAAIDEMAVSIQQVSDNSQVAAGVAKEALTNAAKGNEAVRDTMEGMNRIRDQVQETAKRIKRLGETTQEIGQIIQLIDDIADRTSILALNASIQAASAGEAGRGFAVVAGEVERLAERSTDATKKIATLVKTIQGETNEAVAAMEKSIHEVVSGSKLANQAGTSLQEIQSVSGQLAELIQSISQAASQQARGSEALAASMTEISTITQKTATGTKQANESVTQLADLADTLRQSVSAFRLPGGNAAA